MTRERERLQSIREDIASLLTLLAGEQAFDPKDRRIRRGLEKALDPTVKDFFSIKASDASARAFRELCVSVDELPEDHKAFVVSALNLVGAGPGVARRWARRSSPHPTVMPEAAKAFDLALYMILNETPADTEMRIFHLVAGRLAHAARMARAGMSWTSALSPPDPAAEYDEAALDLRDRLQEQFTRLDARHVAVMDDRLRRYRPLTFDPGLAPVGHVNTPGQRERIAAMNVRAKVEARPYQTGEMTVARTMAMLGADGPRTMEGRACMVSYATNLYFVDDTPLLAVQVDETGEIQAVDIPQIASPTLQ